MTGTVSPVPVMICATICTCTISLTALEVCATGLTWIVAGSSEPSGGRIMRSAGSSQSA